MGRNINWSRKIIFIILLFSNLAYTQHNKFNSNNILLLVQIESVKDHIVKFKTIEIYNYYNIVINIPVNDNRAEQISVGKQMFLDKSYEALYSRQIKRRNIGEILCLEVNPKQIDEMGFIMTVNKVYKPKKLRLGDFHPIRHIEH